MERELLSAEAAAEGDAELLRRAVRCGGNQQFVLSNANCGFAEVVGPAGAGLFPVCLQDAADDHAFQATERCGGADKAVFEATGYCGFASWAGAVWFAAQ